MAHKSIPQWHGIVEESNNDVRIWAGVDVHKRNYSVALLSDNGVIHNYSASSDPQALIERFRHKHIKVHQLVYEAGLSGFNLARACQAAEVPVMVVAASKIPRPPVHTAKTDAIDCLQLATLAAKGMLKSIAIPTVEQETKRALVRRRTQLAQNIRIVKQRIKSLLICHGIDEPDGLKHWSKAGREALAQLSMAPYLRYTLDSLLRELDFQEKEKAELESVIKAVILPEHDVLQTVPGIGPTISAAFRSEVFAPERFVHAEEVSSYLGLSPCVRQSGESKAKSKLMPAGQSNLRSMLIEACWVLKRQEKWAADFYNRIKQRTGRFQQAICALARKLAVLLWRLLLDNRDYQSNYCRS
jgi:transposase